MEKVSVSRTGHSEKEKHHHRGKSSEGFLNQELILQNLNIQAGQIILDAGCGNGYMSKAFSTKVTPSGKVYALDPDKESIEILRNETLGSNIEAMEGDITQPTGLNQSSIDFIYVSTVIHGFSRPEMQGFLGEARRLLKPGGVLAIVEIDKKETPFGPPLNLRFAPEELHDIVPLAPLITSKVGEHFYMMIFKNIIKEET